LIRLLLGIAGLALAGCAFAAGPLTVVTEDFPPYSYARGGKLAGYSVDVARAALDGAGLVYSMNIYPWARAYQMGRAQPNVLIFSIVRTPEREKQFQWIAQIAKRSVYLYKLAARRDVSVDTVADMRRYRIAANRGDIVEEQLHQLGLDADLSRDDQTSMKKLLMGRVDLMVASEASIKGVCAGVGISCTLLERTMPMPGLTDYYVAASLGTPADTVRQLRAGFARIKDSPLIDRLAEKYGVDVR
jgi:polar amino acid transport system substrate-binding protein